MLTEQQRALLRRALVRERGLLPLGRRELVVDGRERAFALREQLLDALARLVERGLELAAFDLAHANPREHGEHTDLALTQRLELGREAREARADADDGVARVQVGALDQGQYVATAQRHRVLTIS